MTDPNCTRYKALSGNSGKNILLLKYISNKVIYGFQTVKEGSGKEEGIGVGNWLPSRYSLMCDRFLRAGEPSLPS